MMKWDIIHDKDYKYNGSYYFLGTIWPITVIVIVVGFVIVSLKHYANVLKIISKWMESKR